MQKGPPQLWSRTPRHPAWSAAAAAGKLLRDGGIDVLYCSHRDGSLSVWQRHPRLLTFGCLGASKLLPPAPKFGTGARWVAFDICVG